MAADWLDVARYADSYGFQVDRERDTWPYRDWVIRAFNDTFLGQVRHLAIGRRPAAPGQR